MRFLRCGDNALLLEVDAPELVPRVAAALEISPLEGVVDTVPGAQTLLLRFETGETNFEEVSAAIKSLKLPETVEHDKSEVVIPVSYDGEDLEAVAAQTGLTIDEVIRLHSAGAYRVAFGGFAPGFAYIAGLDPKLHVGRHTTPRTQVAAGSVAIADEYTAIYPRASPGGWLVIGHTDLVTWDLQRTPPALLLPGAAIRFVDIAR